jgi:polysaccharide biosynthesis transport protein
VAKAGTNVEALLLLPVVAKDAKVVEIQMTISKLDSDLANLRQRYKAKHPKYIQAVSQIEEWRDTFTNAVRKAPETAKLALESAKASEDALSEALRTQEAAAMGLNKLSIQYNVLSREVEADRALYEAVLSQMKQTSVAKEAQPTKVKIIQVAYVPEKPFAPNKVKVLGIALLASILVGGFVVLGLHSADHSFKTVDQVEEVLQLPVLGAVPVMPQVLRHGRIKKPSQLIVSDDPKCAGSEAFRTLRTSLTMLGRAENRRVFLFTSAVPQEGKTFTSLNYSACLAQLGLRTLLIDCDLRKPSVEEGLGIKDGNSVGVTDYLTGQKKFEEILQASKIEKMSFISAGTTAPNPAELVAQGGFPGLLQEALLHFDRVIVDSAPIHAVSDTLLMVPHVQTVCVVARAARTPRKAITRAIQLLRSAGVPIAGVVLNRLPRRRGSGYGYYYCSPYYDYAYYGKYSKKGVYGTK